MHHCKKCKQTLNSIDWKKLVPKGLNKSISKFPKFAPQNFEGTVNQVFERRLVKLVK